MPLHQSLRVVIAGRASLEAQTAAMRRRFEEKGVPAPAVESQQGLPTGPGVAAVVALPHVKVGAADLDQLPDLRVVATPSVGLDHIDVAAIESRGLRVANAPGYNSREVAEHTLAMITMLARDIPGGQRSVPEGHWGGRGLSSRRFADIRVGIIGFGQVAQQLAALCRALGMPVNVNCRSPLPGGTPNGVHRVADLSKLLSGSDIVCPLVSLVPETRGLLGAEEFAAMPPNSYLVNNGRGELVDDDALLGALESGHLAGAAIDVVAPEPPPLDHPLLNHPQVIVTPHMAWCSPQSAVAAYERVADTIVDECFRSTPSPS